MKKLSETFKIGCAVSKYINCPPCGVTNPIAAGSYYGDYFNCDFWKLRTRLAEYEEIGLEPDEIKAIIQDGEELADAYIRYRNRCVELEEGHEADTDEYKEADGIMKIFRYISKLEEKAKNYDAIMRALELIDLGDE